MIPRKLHFIFGLSEDFGGKPFSFFHWAAIKSAQVNNPNFETHFWFSHKPENYFFEDLEESMVLHPILAPKEIFGNPIPHFAHQTDLLRLQVLQEQGGIYQDLDTFTVRTFDPLLLHKFVMAQELVESKNVGLCNAVILSEPNHPFVTSWVEKFRSFRSTGRDQFWNESAVVWPWQIYCENREGVTVLSTDAFFKPDWSKQGLEELFVDCRDFPNAYTHHLWESFSWHALSKYNERNCAHHESTYSRLLRTHLNAPMQTLAERRREQVREMLTKPKSVLNLGYKTTFCPDFVNADSLPDSGMDIVMDYENEQWPFPDSSFSQVYMSGVLERLASTEHFFKELFRTCKNKAIIEINLPHPRHDWYLRNPCHNRAWIPESFEHFDLDKCKEWLFDGAKRESLAMDWKIDFKVLSTEYRLPNSDIVQKIPNAFQFGAQNLGEAMHYLQNTIGEFRVRLMCRKH